MAVMSCLRVHHDGLTCPFFLHEFALRRKPVHHDNRLSEIQFYVQVGSARLCDGRACTARRCRKIALAFKVMSSEPSYRHAGSWLSCCVASCS